MEYTEGSGTTPVTGSTTDVRPRTPNGIRDATDCSSFGCSSSDAGTPDITRTGILLVVSTGSRLLQDEVLQLRSNGT